MATYFISIFAKPLQDNPLSEKVDEARVFFWIVDESSETATILSAFSSARFSTHAVK